MTKGTFDLLVLALLASSFVVLEQWLPFRRHEKEKSFIGSHLMMDIIAVLVTFTSGAFATQWMARIFTGSSFIPDEQIGKFFSFSIGIPKVILACLLIDLANYWIHRSLHEFPWMFRFHDWHHTTHRLSWLAGFRASLVHNVLLTFLPQFVIPFVLLRCNPLEASIAFTSQVVFQVWVHSNVDFKKTDILGIFITPAFHRVHHMLDTRAYNSNYAGMFAFYDKIFGTYVAPETLDPSAPYGWKEPNEKFTLSQYIRFMIGL